MEYLSKIDAEKIKITDVYKDVPHPTDQGRTYLRDAESRIEKYLTKKRQQTGMPIWNSPEVAGISN